MICIMGVRSTIWTALLVVSAILLFAFIRHFIPKMFGVGAMPSSMAQQGVMKVYNIITVVVFTIVLLVIVLVLMFLWFIHWLIKKFAPWPFKQILLGITPFPELRKLGIIKLFDGIFGALKSRNPFFKKLFMMSTTVGTFLKTNSQVMIDEAMKRQEKVGKANNSKPDDTYDPKNNMSKSEQSGINDAMSICLKQSIVPGASQSANMLAKLDCMAGKISSADNMLKMKLN